MKSYPQFYPTEISRRFLLRSVRFADGLLRQQSSCRCDALPSQGTPLRHVNATSNLAALDNWLLEGIACPKQELARCVFLRGAPEQRWQTYQVAAQNKILTVDEIRAAEGFGPMPKGKDQHSQVE